MSEENDAKLWLKSSLGVAALSIGGYLLGFAYEKGYADYFGIPVQLVKLNLISIFLSIFGLAAMMLILIGYVNTGYIFFREKNGVIFRAIIRSAPSVLFCAAVFYIYRNTLWRNMLLATITVWPIYMLFMEFIVPLITQRGKGTYYQKLETQEEKNKQMEPTSIWDLFTYKRSVTITLYLITTISLLYVFANWAGMVEAREQKGFFIIKEPKPFVVLRIYGDKFICAPFDSKARTVEKTLYILDTPKQDGIWLDWREVGPLKPVDKKILDVNN
jgi:phage shock protein PspC (stress-responsive transcriptional regulator)